MSCCRPKAMSIWTHCMTLDEPKILCVDRESMKREQRSRRSRKSCRALKLPGILHAQAPALPRRHMNGQWHNSKTEFKCCGARDADAQAQSDKRSELKSILGERSSLQQEFFQRQKSHQVSPPHLSGRTVAAKSVLALKRP